MKRLLALSALVVSGALCLGFAANQMLKPAPVAQAASSVAAAPAPITTGSITSRASATTASQALPALPQANAPAPATVVAQAQGTLPALPALPPIQPVSAAVPAVAGVPQAAQAQPGVLPVAAAPVFAPAAPVPPPTSYRFMEVDGPYIAITFDDGPNPETTPKLLKILEARNIKATFFMLGTNASAYPDVVRAVAAGGNEIGNHSWNHPQLPKLTIAAADKQIEDTSAAIEAAIGKKPLYLRPPYGAMTPALQQHLVQKYGITMIFWSVDPLDWKIRDAQSIYDQVMKQVRPGAIILAHDIHATTVAAMPRVLDALIAKGYKFVTVSELIAMNKPGAPKQVAALAPTPAKKKTRPAPKPSAAQASPANAARNNVSVGLY
ncbi:polysaccharide deacetylase family protein [Roseixanthobacter glucoisosaccharinicivorans]|uniref:polysaccharide deacetylase family protein n=1 Tax=Roseixanthobacter glucoisosaccharinicivorans TaxID=3119923 RepID=UPI003726C1B3